MNNENNIEMSDKQKEMSTTTQNNKTHNKAFLSSKGICALLLSALIAVGGFFCWSGRKFIKYLLIFAIIWWIFGDGIKWVVSSSCDFIGDSINNWREESRKEDEYERKMNEEALKRKHEVEDREFQRTLRFDENAEKHREWEREQQGKRNDVENEMMREGKFPSYEHGTSEKREPKEYNITREISGNKIRVLIR